MKMILIGIQAQSKSLREVKSDQSRTISNTIFTANAKSATQTFIFQSDYFNHSFKQTLLIPEIHISGEIFGNS